MNRSSLLLTRVASASNRISPNLKKQDSFNRTYENGKCHVTTINACTDEHAVLKITPAKGFVSVKIPKIFPLPKEAVEGLKHALIESKKPAKVIQHEADQVFSFHYYVLMSMLLADRKVESKEVPSVS